MINNKTDMLDFTFLLPKFIRAKYYNKQINLTSKYFLKYCNLSGGYFYLHRNTLQKLQQKGDFFKAQPLRPGLWPRK